MTYKTLKVTLDTRGVMTVALNRPEVRNAFNEVMIEEISRIFRIDAVAPEIRAIVLRGEGPVFCSGGDLNWMRHSVDLSFEENLKDTRNLTEMFAVINESSKPIIGLLQGAALGGGVGLASVCDIVIASSETQFSLSEVRLGIVPACIGPFVVAKIGASQARKLFISSERFSTTLASQIGLIHETVPNPAMLDEALEKFLSNILICGPHAIAIAKRLVLDLSWPERRDRLSDSQEYVSKTLAELRVSPEGQEGVRAFLEKRKPAWLPNIT